MPLRRIVLLPVAALVAATGAAGAGAARASSSTICVALVVDGRSIGGPVSTGCAKVDKGATGVDVLHAEGHSVTFRSDGLICTIDGLPKSGCADVDDSHYWAYFHRAPGTSTWTYSTEGPSTYQPANTSTDGWVYDDGSSLTPDNVPYSQICKPASKPKPSPTPTRTHHHHPAAHPTRTQHVRSSPSASASATTSAPRLGSAHVHRAHGRSSARRSHPPHPPRTLSPGRILGYGGPYRATGSSQTVGGSSGGHGGLALGVGIAAVAVLGGLAFWRFRRAP